MSWYVRWARGQVMVSVGSVGSTENTMRACAAASMWPRSAGLISGWSVRASAAAATASGPVPWGGSTIAARLTRSLSSAGVNCPARAIETMPSQTASTWGRLSLAMISRTISPSPARSCVTATSAARVLRHVSTRSSKAAKLDVASRRDSASMARMVTPSTGCVQHPMVMGVTAPRQQAAGASGTVSRRLPLPAGDQLDELGVIGVERPVPVRLADVRDPLAEREPVVGHVVLGHVQRPAALERLGRHERARLEERVVLLPAAVGFADHRLVHEAPGPV